MAIDPRRAQVAAAPQNAAPLIRPRSRGVWTFFSFFLFALALIGGETAAHYQPDLALSFRQIVANLLGKLPDTVMPERLWQVAGGAAVVLVVLLIWQAGRTRRPLFFPIALFLCAVSCTVGLWRGGRDIDLERNAARVSMLESDLGALQKKLDVATGSLQQSSIAIQDRDKTLDDLRKELEELKKKLAEKN
jgi:hypothetical protein